MLKYTYCYLLFFFFFGLSFVFIAFDFASLYVFVASLTRPASFECITRFVNLESGEFEEGLSRIVSFQVFSPEDLRHF